MNHIKGYLKWDGEKNRDLLLFRKMKWENPKKLLKQYPKQELKKIFFKYYFKFDKKNQAFWKLILGINNEEIKQKTNRIFKRHNII